jgi:hypothetical protein
MNNINFLTSGLVQLNSGTGINGVTNVTVPTTTSTATTATDCNIFPVSTTIDSSNCVYDAQTILMVNSTLNQNANTVIAQYFDPVTGTPNTGNPFGGWNFDLTNTSYLNGVFASSSLLNEDTVLFNNIQPYQATAPLNATGTHNIDITNGSGQPYPGNPNGFFFSLTSKPYIVNSANTGLLPSPPTTQNTNPGYSNYNSDNFLFVSNYYVVQKNEIIIVELLFTVSNTASLNVNATSVQGSPTLSVIIRNKVISQDVLASIASSSSGPSPKVKVYTAGPVPLQYILNGGTFNSTTACSFINNNIPIIIAPGYVKLYATLPIAYIPANATNSYYLNNAGYTFVDSAPTLNTVVGTGISATTVITPSHYGHFVVGVAYSVDYSVYSKSANINAEVLIKNIWRSPVAIYNSYNQYSVNDMATKQVVLLFGKSFNGGTFLVTNTGTPISSVNNYAVTSLRNFISIMRAIINLFDGSVSLVDYFINPNVVAQVNLMGSYNINVLILQPLLDGAITNPPTVAANPGMWFLALNSKNSANMSIDPTEQVVFGQNIGFNYLGLPNSLLASCGSCNYKNFNIDMLSDSEGDLFGNSVSLGLNAVGTQTYYMLVILPEAQFNPAITTTNSIITIYTAQNTLFYINLSTNSAAQFAPNSAGMVAQTSSRTSTNSSSTSSSLSVQPVFNISKLMLSASNTRLF